MAACCTSGGERSIPASSRPWKRSLGTGWPEQVERWLIMLRGPRWDKALTYCRQAGEKAMARSAHREAVGYFEQALHALPHLPETRDTREQAIDLRLAPRTALCSVWRLEAHPLAYLREAESLARALDNPRRLGRPPTFSPFISATVVRMTRLSLPPSVPSHCPRPAGMSSCRRWRTFAWAKSIRPRATIVRRSTASQTVAFFDGRGATSASARLSCPP